MLHVSPYKFPLPQEMLVQVPLDDSYEIPVHKTRVKQDLKLAQMLETVSNTMLFDIYIYIYRERERERESLQCV